MPKLRRGDPRFAFRGLWTGAQAAVKSATGFAFNWGFLARGARSGFSFAKINFHKLKNTLIASKRESPIR